MLQQQQSCHDGFKCYFKNILEILENPHVNRRNNTLTSQSSQSFSGSQSQQSTTMPCFDHVPIRPRIFVPARALMRERSNSRAELFSLSHSSASQRLLTPSLLYCCWISMCSNSAATDVMLASPWLRPQCHLVTLPLGSCCGNQWTLLLSKTGSVWQADAFTENLQRCKQRWVRGKHPDWRWVYGLLSNVESFRFVCFGGFKRLKKLLTAVNSWNRLFSVFLF